MTPGRTAAAEEKYEQEFRRATGRYYADRAARYSLTEKKG